MLRHYFVIAGVALALALVVTFKFVSNAEWQIHLSILGIPFTFFYFVQKQKLEELELFKELFKEFNARYDGLNEKLNAIRVEPPDKQIDDDEQKTLFDYFNLCGEEYLFYRQGYIYPEVWEAWYNGMTIFRKNPRIKKLWDEELENDSYYGFRWNGLPRNGCCFCLFQ
jgi:hypothetical protein